MKVVCVIPGFNEESTIGDVVRGARKYCDKVVVVDDGSSDGTGEAASRAGAKVLRHLVRLGTGAALSTGFVEALKAGAGVVLSMDGDGQHSPEDIPSLLKPILDGEADVVLGSRFLGNAKPMPLHKRLGNKILSAVTSWACGHRVTDSQCGFRAYSRRVIEAVRHGALDYGWASEIIVRAVKGGFRVKEIPVRTVYPKGRWRGAGVIDGLKILYRTLKFK